MASSEEAAVAKAAEVVAGVEATTDGESSGSEASTESHEFPTFDVDIPADIAALLEEDDADATAVTDEELDSLAEENEDVPREVLARMLKAEKRAEHLEKLRVNESKKNWGEEAKEYFPLSEPFLDQIEATSKRGFLRTAKQINDRMKPLVEEKVLKPAREAIEAERAKTKEEAKAEARDAWGQPIVENEEKPVPKRVENETRRRVRGDFSDVVRGLIFNKEE